VLLDGTIVRQIKAKEFRQHDPELFALYTCGAIVIVCATVVGFVVPFTLHPLAMPCVPLVVSLLLSREQSRNELQDVAYVVCDEWHELIGTKRGVQVQLALARLRRFNPALVTWGLSATLGNSEHAMAVLCGLQPARPPLLVRGRMDKPLVIDTLIPPDPGRYSWAGHLGARMQAAVREVVRVTGWHGAAVADRMGDYIGSREGCATSDGTATPATRRPSGPRSVPPPPPRRAGRTSVSRPISAPPASMATREATARAPKIRTMGIAVPRSERRWDG